jgi:hypothetical protein
MSWIRVVHGVPTYSGRLRQPEAYDRWVRTAGAELIAAAARQRGFALLGRVRAARNALWADLQTSAEKGALADALRHAVRQFVTAAGEIAAAPVKLPRAYIEGRRLVVVPRVTCIARGFNAMARDLDLHPDIVRLQGGTALRDFFYDELVAAIDTSLMQTAASMHHPMPTGEGWFVIGFEPSLSWLVPLMGGPERRGHFFVYEAPTRNVKRWPFRALEASVLELQTCAGSLSRVARGEILRGARGMTDPPLAFDTLCAKVS